MNFDKYTDRAKGFVQAAQGLALREGHQQFGTDHLLKVLLDDPEGMAAGLIQRAAGRPGEALGAVEADPLSLDAGDARAAGRGLHPDGNGEAPRPALHVDGPGVGDRQLLRDALPFRNLLALPRAGAGDRRPGW